MKDIDMNDSSIDDNKVIHLDFIHVALAAMDWIDGADVDDCDAGGEDDRDDCDYDDDVDVDVGAYYDDGADDACACGYCDWCDVDYDDASWHVDDDELCRW